MHCLKFTTEQTNCWQISHCVQQTLCMLELTRFMETTVLISSFFIFCDRNNQVSNKITHSHCNQQGSWYHNDIETLKSQAISPKQEIFCCADVLCLYSISLMELCWNTYVRVFWLIWERLHFPFVTSQNKLFQICMFQHIFLKYDNKWQAKLSKDGPSLISGDVRDRLKTENMPRGDD